MTRTSSREAISTRQQKIATLARQAPERVLTTLAHHIDHEWLAEAYRRTRKDGATGVDGVTAAQYEQQLEANLDDLLSRFKNGSYRAPPARRVHIPKGRGGETRPLGIPTLEDKVLQRAVLMVLEPVYVMAVLGKRFARFGLQLHPGKTRLVGFQPPRGPSNRSTSFDLLGFTHYWGRSRKGRWVIKRKTAKSRLARAVQHINQWCRSYRHAPIDEQHAALVRRMRGHYAYYGITGNGRALARFQRQVERCWRKWLHRRSNRSRMNWDRFQLVLDRYPLPPPRVVHSVYRSAATL